MKCPSCKHTKFNVVSGRTVLQGHGYWRRMKCPSCGLVMTTVEQFCVTISGTGDKGKKEPQLAVPPVPDIEAPEAGRRPKRERSRKYAKKSVVQHVKEAVQVFVAKVYKPVRITPEDAELRSARSRIEDLKMQRELDNL